MSILDIGGGLQVPGQSEVRGPPRIGMRFSSTLRLDTVGAPGVGTRGDATRRLLDYYGTTKILSTVPMAVNPNSIRVTQAKRIVKRDTQEGSVFFHFVNSKGQNNDLAIVTFAGNTGNLDLRGSETTVETRTRAIDTGALYKLYAWHNLYALTREPMLLSNRQRNRFFIQMTTALFPDGILLIGHYNKVLDYDETGAKPHSRNYNFEFTVKETTPDVDKIIGAMQTFDSLSTSALQDSVTTEIINNTVSTGTAPVGAPTTAGSVPFGRALMGRGVSIGP